MSGHKRFTIVGSITTPEQRRAASRAVCAWSATHGGPDVARELLDTLGIRPATCVRLSAGGGTIKTAPGGAGNTDREPDPQPEPAGRG